MQEGEKESKWVNTPVSNLVRFVASGIYFARVRVRGKLIRKSLKTDVFSVAQLRLADFIKEQRAQLDSEERVTNGKMTFGDVLQVYRQRLEANPKLKPNAKLYRRKCIDALLKSWPEVEITAISKISKDACLSWAENFAEKYSPSVYNNTVGTLRQIIDLAIKKGARYSNPALEIPKRKPTKKILRLPNQEQFQAFVHAIEKAGAWCSQECADLVRFLAYGGFRKEEAANITWADCDFERGLIMVRGHSETGTKNSEVRLVPMIPEMQQLLERIKAERPNDLPALPVMKVRECQKAMDNAVKKVGMTRITHHDLRHLFATQCIESGVDIPTVSRWLGHKDGGALAMRVYGHLRDRHSTEMAKRVSFGGMQTSRSK